jgi:hypothetical protein
VMCMRAELNLVYWLKNTLELLIIDALSPSSELLYTRFWTFDEVSE